MVEDVKHFGYYEIRKIQLSESDSSNFWFYDVNILATREEDVETLTKLSTSDGVKCCWWENYQN